MSALTTMEPEHVTGKEVDPSPPSLGEDPEAVLRRSSPGRFLLKVAAVVLGIGAIGGGAYFGMNALAAHRAKNVPEVKFDDVTATIGNDLFEPEKPMHDVRIDSFALDKTEVTVSAYRTCLAQAACTEPAKGAFCNLEQDGRDNHPMNCVTQEQAAAFCAWAGKRLPTEKEWERAARVVHHKKKAEEPRYNQGEGLYPWGNDIPTRRLANVCNKECRAFGAERGQAWPSMYADEEDGFATTAPVGSFEKGDTPDGLQDMAGNVWEWTKSPYCEYPADVCGNEIEYVIRGGGWLSYHWRNLEVTTREAMPKTDANHGVGFRCARSL
jgi:formylglycine-generating enzyme required for sulfatase activity